jgi:lysophospholipase L1-like esterase
MGGTDATATLTCTGSNATLWYAGYADSGTASYVVDGGTTHYFSFTASTPYTGLSIPLGADGPHTIVFSFPGSARVLLAGVEVTSATSGVLVCNMGVGGAKTYNWALMTSNFTSHISPQLSIIELGTNDWIFQVPISTFTSNLSTLCNLLATYGPVVLVTIPNAMTSENTYPIPKTQYNNAIRAVASAGGYSVVDWYSYWGTYAQNIAWGLLNPTAAYHPSVSGYATVAGLLWRSIFPDNWLGSVTAASPTISTGTAAPSTTPAKVGDIFVDTTNKKLYFATGTSSSSDWTIAN